MSFLKISDPAKRDFFFQELRKTKRKIKENFISEKFGNQGQQRDFIKDFKPLLEAQSKISTELGVIKDSSTSTATALKALPASISLLKSVQFPQYPSIEAYDDPASGIRTLELGDFATKYLLQYASRKKETDKVFGIRSTDDIFLHRRETNFYRRRRNNGSRQDLLGNAWAMGTVNEGWKYRNIIKPIWDAKTGKGSTSSFSHKIVTR